ncbi:DUF2484 family protein [Lutimaribacter sp. EGI FJ00015]|uniref:DUF2484 family protein n=1 Tax=Lutimaribacter degradans TaxID=2945989 RepID=A0ACC5ZR09_9RHOB|nr:DUF2484 family protein [Lutimaribacter sp. EGI FJ00013]MCM2560687.1 DUF2484 family protein [Lutimaribacter sp. EGI FJ00013]MCO0612369.1 DUF2484 family protein [Lutimaribacter sp. EGI FJ00015]MCO0634511.1 DUF2484 family protein [Lutimaribacter sp. EGI FJ00014]
MSAPLALACLWLVVANILAMIPSRDNHWTRAYVLIALGLPLLGWIMTRHGVGIGLLVLLAAMSILRSPVIYLARWSRRRLGSGR